MTQNELEYAKIYKHMEDGDFKTAVRMLETLEQRGEAKASYLLGYMYYSGKGVEESRVVALGYLEKSARAGFIPAIKFLSGLEKKQNAPGEKEIADLQKKADAGDAKSAYKYAMLFMKGEGVKRDKQTAIKYFTAAAEAGHFLSMIALFDRYAIDADVEKQWSRAYHWFKQAWLIDRDRLNIVHPNVIRGEQCFLEAEDESLSVEKRKELLEQAAKEGFHGAYVAYGDLCDGEDAVDFYQKGVEFGDCEALRRMVHCCESGYGVEQSDNNADFYRNEYERLSYYIGK